MHGSSEGFEAKLQVFEAKLQVLTCTFAHGYGSFSPFNNHFRGF